MRTVTSNEAKLTLHKLIDESAKSHQPIFIIGERNSALLRLDFNSRKHPSSAIFGKLLMFLVTSLKQNEIN